MTEQGYKLELKGIRDPGQVAEAIREYGMLEAKGWKSREGTAVTADNAQGRFYREVFERFCARGEGANLPTTVERPACSHGFVPHAEWHVYHSQDVLRRGVERVLAGISDAGRSNEGTVRQRADAVDRVLWPCDGVAHSLE